jgi:hypothetical protein
MAFLTTETVSIEQMFRDATIHRYEHGGGRVFWEGPDGRRRLLLDLYGTDDDTGAVREYVLNKLGIGEAVSALDVTEKNHGT